MPITATLALVLWPVITIILFRKRPPAEALCWCIIAGYLLLPGRYGWNLPGLPTLNKQSVPALAAIAAVLIFHQSKKVANLPADVMLPGWLPQPLWIKLLFGMIALGAFGTYYNNTSGFTAGARQMPGLGPYDAFSTLMTAATMMMPLLLGRKLLAHPRSHIVLLSVIGVAALFYAVPTLYEARMSPQLNRTVYGFFSQDWRQVFRGGGWRPMVFLQHGLFLAIFFACALIAIAGLIRSEEPKKRQRWYAALAFIAVIMVLANSLGALLIAIFLMPVVLFTSRNIQLMVATGLAAIVLLYPLLRSNDLVPTGQILSLIERIDSGRAGSLQYRFDNEDILLEKAREKPLFGWGTWGRARIFNAKGEDISTTDGYWVILFGEGGIVRYLAEYGMMSLPIIVLFLRRKKYEITNATAAVSLVLVANMVDTIPNSALTPITWLLVGALIGRVELGRISDTATDPQPKPAAPRIRYARNHPPPPPRKRADPTPRPAGTLARNRLHKPSARLSQRKEI